LEKARSSVAGLFREIDMATRTLVGVAGTWSSLGAMALGLLEYSRDLVHGSLMHREALQELIEDLAQLTIEETAAIPSLDPNRAPVILGGAVIAEGVMSALHVDEVVISEHDTLDGVAMELLALP
jgi:exopolyphosphatase/guanosine-5'-triphosphate,3'-diphosphate pyrophosphatase